jgi:hypothetical protein
MAISKVVSKQPANKEAARRASTLAAREIEPLADKSMPAEEQERREKALIRGPKGFRDIRNDQPKAKG